MTNPIKVLVVDDSMVIRRVLSKIIESDRAFELVGTAKDGEDAVEKIQSLEPDVVTMDVEMPNVDGLEALRELRKRRLRLPVVMFSALTERGGRKTLEALSLGASDYVTKPDSSSGAGGSTDQIRAVLLPKLKALGARKRRSPMAPPAPPRAGGRPAVLNGPGPVKTNTRQPAPTRPVCDGRPRQPKVGPVDAIMVGISTGGPNALQDVMSELRTDRPIAITQHMPPMFTRLLAERLNSISSLEVLEGEPGMVMKPGRAIIAPGDFHMEFRRKGAEIVVNLTQGPPENSCRPAVDVMFRSALDVYGPNLLAVVMTGMGHDGAAGAKEIHDRGGRVLIQDEPTSVVWGMPGA
ncbi:MAG: chemotaxis-specific protein-glutamate methyltransferase CheB, partial [Planctomycetota bacterium]